MVSLDYARKFALSLDEVVEGPHHDVVSFKVKSKIFMTMNAKENRICIRLSPIDQSVFSAFDAGSATEKNSGASCAYQTRRVAHRPALKQ